MLRHLLPRAQDAEIRVANANRCAVPNKVEEQVEGCKCFRPFLSAVSPTYLA